VVSDAGIGQSKAIARGEVDFSLNFAAPLVIPIDAGDAISIIAGVHSGASNSSEMNAFAASRISRARRLGARPGWVPHVFVAAMAAMSGLILSRISTGSQVHQSPKGAFRRGKDRRVPRLPPEPQELRARKIGRVIISSAIDRPWSQYFCCMLAATGSSSQHPVATKRVLRAILKATDLCASEPERVAQRMVDGGFTPDMTMRSRH